jgi:hypothetical protein
MLPAPAAGQHTENRTLQGMHVSMEITLVTRQQLVKMMLVGPWQQA